MDYLYTGIFFKLSSFSGLDIQSGNGVQGEDASCEGL